MENIEKKQWTAPKVMELSSEGTSSTSEIQYGFDGNDNYTDYNNS